MHQRTALDAREYGLIEIILVVHSLAGKNQAAPGSPEGLVGGGCGHIRVGNRTGMKACRHQTGNVRHVHH